MSLWASFRTKKKPTRINTGRFLGTVFNSTDSILDKDKYFSYSCQAGGFQLLGDAADQDLLFVKIFLHGLALHCFGI